MPREDRMNLSLQVEVVEKARVYYEKDPMHSKISFTQWVSDYLLMNLEKEEFLKIYAPYLSKIGIQDNVLFIRDSKKDKIIEIRLVNNKLYSNDDEPIYLQFALALPELARLKSKSK